MGKRWQYLKQCFNQGFEMGIARQQAAKELKEEKKNAKRKER